MLTCPAWDHPVNPVASCESCQKSDAGSRRAAGITLLELLLVLALLMMVISAVGFYVGPWLTRPGYEAEAAQFAAALRYARAEAAHTGRVFRLEFEPIEGADGTGGGEPRYRVRVRQERRPLDEPHVFTDVEGLAWVDQLDELRHVAVIDVRLTGPDAAALRQLADELDADDDRLDGLSSVTFYPDGTAESAEIVLAPLEDPADPAEALRVVVRVAGLTGRVTHELTTAARWEARHEPRLDEDEEADADESLLNNW